MPPLIPSWEWFADALHWGEASDTVPDARRWWFELRLHATYGTLELRVPDAQSSVDDVHGVAAFAYGLIHALAARFDAGETLPVARLVADRREPLGGDARRRRRARSPTSRPASGCPRASCCASRLDALPAPGLDTARADRGQRRHPHAGGRRGAGVRGAAAWTDRSAALLAVVVVASRSSNQPITRRQASSAACALKRGAGVVEERVVGLGERQHLVVQPRRLERRLGRRAASR